MVPWIWTGKTVVFCTVARRRAGDGRVLILAHREELIEQARQKYFTVTGELTAKEKAGESCLGSGLDVVVGSVQTLQSKKRLANFAQDYFSTIIIDEAHHALAASYQRILGDFTDGEPAAHGELVSIHAPEWGATVPGELLAALRG